MISFIRINLIRWKDYLGGRRRHARKRTVQKGTTCYILVWISLLHFYVFNDWFLKRYRLCLWGNSQNFPNWVPFGFLISRVTCASVFRNVTHCINYLHLLRLMSSAAACWCLRLRSRFRQYCRSCFAAILVFEKLFKSFVFLFQRLEFILQRV